MLSVIMLSVIILSVDMLSVITLTVVMLSVVMLSVIALIRGLLSHSTQIDVIKLFWPKNLPLGLLCWSV